MTTVTELPYRRGVGLVIFNDQGLVLAAERRDRVGAWQFPQGGVKPGEAAHVAVMRELKEEIGNDKAEIIACHSAKLTYEFPDYLMRDRLPYRGKYRGQEQSWFALRYLGADADIDLSGQYYDEPPEFIAWEWRALGDMVNLIVPFKRPVYEAVAKEFLPLAEKIRRKEPLPVWRPPAGEAP